MKGVKFNGLFGLTFNIDDKGKITDNLKDEEQFGDNVRENVMRETGLREELMSTELSKDAIFNPQKYMTVKQADMERVGQNVAQYFQLEFLRFLRTGMSEEKARDMAMDEAKEYKERLIKKHELTFPQKVTRQSINHAFGIKNTGKDLTLGKEKGTKPKSKPSTPLRIESNDTN